MTASIKHLYAQHKVLSLIGVRDEKGLGGAILLPIIQIQLLHVVV